MSKTYRGVGGIELPNDEFPAKITKGFYRVLEENSEDAAEIGAYKLLANAIKTCEGNLGSCVVADAGVRIYQQGAEEETPDTPVGPGDPGTDTPDTPTGPDDPGASGTDKPGSDEPADPGTDEPGGEDPSAPDDPVAPDDPTEPGTPDSAPTEVVGYAKLKTLMNVRTAPSSDSGLVRTYKEDTIVAVTQFLDNGWLCILCEDAASGLAYISNEDGRYATTGRSLYTVKKEDNLWKIAEEQLGDGSRYKEISEINFLVSNRIKVGMSLILPEVIPTAEDRKSVV